MRRTGLPGIHRDPEELDLAEKLHGAAARYAIRQCKPIHPAYREG